MIFVKQRENLNQLKSYDNFLPRHATQPCINYELYMRFVRFRSTAEEIVKLEIEQEWLEDEKAIRGKKTKSEENRRVGYISRGTWTLEESLEVKEEKYALNVSSSLSYRGISTAGIDNKDAEQRRSTLYFALDDQGTFTAETGGLRLLVRLPRYTRSLETEEEVSGRQRGRE